MNPLAIELPLAVLIGAAVIDFIFGEPRKYVHTNTVIKKAGVLFDPYFRTFNNKRVAGFFYLMFLIMLFGIPVYLALIIMSKFFIVYIILGMILLKESFSLTSIAEDIEPVVKALEEGRIDEARVFASKFVKRDTIGLDAGKISSAVIETISSTFLNDVVAPLLYFALFGIPGAFITRVINVIDSLVGQKNHRNYDFGKWPAIIHTLVNYIPARISSFLIVVGSELLNYRVSTVPLTSVRAALDSPGNGLAIGTVASSLNIRLEKVGSYVINDNGFDPSVGDIKRVLNIYYMAFYVYMIILVIPIMIILYLI